MAKKAVKRKAKSVPRPDVTPEAAVTAAEILDRARRQRPSKHFKRAARSSLAHYKHQGFEWQRGFSSIDGSKIVRLRERGQSITGIIGEVANEVWMEGTFPLILDDETMVRVPANRHLRELLKAADCMYQRITITFLGKKYTAPGGHYQKIFYIEPAPEGVGTEGRKLLEAAMAEAQAKPKPKGETKPKTEGR